MPTVGALCTQSSRSALCALARPRRAASALPAHLLAPHARHCPLALASTRLSASTFSPLNASLRQHGCSRPYARSSPGQQSPPARSFAGPSRSREFRRWLVPEQTWDALPLQRAPRFLSLTGKPVWGSKDAALPARGSATMPAAMEPADRRRSTRLVLGRGGGFASGDSTCQVFFDWWPLAAGSWSPGRKVFRFATALWEAGCQPRRASAPFTRSKNSSPTLTATSPPAI